MLYRLPAKSSSNCSLDCSSTPAPPRLDLTALYASYTKRLARLNGLLFVACIEFILSPVVSVMQLPDPTPLLQPHYRAFLAPTSRSAPVLRLGTLASRFWPLALSPFTSERLVPAVPCHRLHPSHALSTPAATRPVIRHLASLSQMRYTHLVSTTLDFLTTRPRKVHFRSSLGCPPARVFLALFPQRSPPTAFDRSSLEVVWDLLLKADPGGPAPIDYTARPRLIRPCDLLTRALLQHTIPQKIKLLFRQLADPRLGLVHRQLQLP